MKDKEDDPPWDLSPVLNLLQSIAPQQTNNHDHDGGGLAAAARTRTIGSSEDNNEGGIQLGNFDKLWDYLGVDRDARSFTPTFEASTAVRNADRDAYASDGSIYYPPSSKSVKWRDEEDGQDLADTQPDSPPSPTSGLTKNQRKKRNRKLRKAGQSDRSGAHPTTSESEEETPKLLRSGKAYGTRSSPKEPHTPSKQMMRLPSGSPSVSQDLSHNRRVRDGPGKELSTANMPKSDEQQVTKTALAAPQQVTTSPAIKVNRTAKVTPFTDKMAEAVDKLTTALAATPKKNSSAPTITAPTTITPNSDKMALAAGRLSSALAATPKHNPSTPITSKVKNVPQSLPNRNKFNDLIPSHVQYAVPGTAPQRSRTQIIMPPPQSADLSAFPVITSTKPQTNPRGRHEILPMVAQVDDRNWSLLLKLLGNFPDDRKHLLSPLQLSINRPQPDGIHVFVDASNILIGYQEHLKRARGIPEYARIEPRVYPSFHALALLLERRRPVAKRVLAGSTPEVAAFEQARQVGYETCILDKVWKAKELTERQKRIAARKHGTAHASSGYDSGDASDGLAAVDAPRPKWVEQAVDEILHLKILESIVDMDMYMDSTATDAATKPRPTMVLATGDAAEAEYSSGFLRMVERALNRGWNVEVMAWGASVSMDYRRLAGSSKWKDRFRIVELDEYVEELFAEVV